MTATEDVTTIKSKYWFQILEAVYGDQEAHKILTRKVEVEMNRRAEKELYDVLVGPDIENTLKTDIEISAILAELQTPSL